MPNDTNCAVCGNAALVEPDSSGFDRSHVECGVCGGYIIDNLASITVSNLPEYRRNILAGVLRNAGELDQRTLISNDNIEILLASARVPRTPLEAADRTLARVTAKATFASVAEIPGLDHLNLFLLTPSDLLGVLRLLIEMGHLRDVKPKSTADPLRNTYLVYITAEGWKRAQELTLPATKSRQGFVAMHLLPDLLPAYADGISPALRETGYEPFRVDRLEHNNKIDDVIISEIRRSGLLIADVTNHRPSVYFEAGFAMGLGLPVIWSVREDHIDSVHFDTRQYSHVVWSDPEDLRKKLLTRLQATVPVSRGNP